MNPVHTTPAATTPIVLTNEDFKQMPTISELPLVKPAAPTSDQKHNETIVLADALLVNENKLKGITECFSSYDSVSTHFIYLSRLGKKFDE